MIILKPVLTLSDHCPIRAVLKVKLVSSIDITENYTFIEKPTKILWNNEISYKFENILQTPPFLSQFDNFNNTDICNGQDAIDDATRVFTNLLISGALQANSVPRLDMKHKQNKISHPKWHDLSCDEVHRKVKVKIIKT